MVVRCGLGSAGGWPRWQARLRVRPKVLLGLGERKTGYFFRALASGPIFFFSCHGGNRPRRLLFTSMAWGDASCGVGAVGLTHVRRRFNLVQFNTDKSNLGGSGGPVRGELGPIFALGGHRGWRQSFSQKKKLLGGAGGRRQGGQGGGSARKKEHGGQEGGSQKGRNSHKTGPLVGGGKRRGARARLDSRPGH